MLLVRTAALLLFLSFPYINARTIGYKKNSPFPKLSISFKRNPFKGSTFDVAALSLRCSWFFQFGGDIMAHVSVDVSKQENDISQITLDPQNHPGKTIQ